MTDAAFEAVVKLYADMVFRLAYSYLKNRADAEDVMQETLLKLYTQDPFDTPEHERFWVVRVAVNECRRLLRSPWRCRTGPLEEAPEPAAQEDSLELLSAVRALPDKYSAVIHLYYYEGYSIKEIAKTLGLPAATVGTRLARGRERLRQMLKEDV